MKSIRLSLVLLCLAAGLAFATPLKAQQYRYDPLSYRGGCTYYVNGRCAAWEGSYSRDRQCIRGSCDPRMRYHTCDPRSSAYQPGCYNRAPVMERSRGYVPRSRHERRPFFQPRGRYHPQYGPPPYGHRPPRGCARPLLSVTFSW
jgi:hypothetical protein